MSKSWLSVLFVLLSFFLVSSSIIPSSNNDSALVSPCAPIPDGLVYWLRAENNSDDFTSTHDGLLYGNTAYVPGKVGNAFTFDGNEDNVVIPSSPDLPFGSDPRTLEMWIYSVHDTWVHDYHPPFFTGVDGVWKAFGIDFETYPRIQFYTWGDDFDVITTLPEEGWFHVAFVYDGNLALTAYINGLPEGSRVLGGILQTVLTNHFIGSGVEEHGYPRYFLGRLDEVSFYNRALSADEILNIFNAGSSGKCPYYSEYMPVILN